MVDELLGLQVTAEHMVDEALRIYQDARLDALDLELHVRRWLVDPPNSADAFDIDAWFERADALCQMPYAEYLQTPEWQEHRRRALRRAGGRCQGCDTDQHLETHHRTYANRGAERAEDLTVLCAACHTAVHLVADGRRGKARADSRLGVLA